MRTLLALALILVAPAAAHAQSVSVGKGDLVPRGLALGPDGAGLLGVTADSTDYSNGISCEVPPTTAGFVSVRSASGALSPLKPLPADVAAGPVRRPDGSFAAVLAQTTGVSGECRPLRTFEFATLDAAGDVVTRTPLIGEVEVWDVQLITGPDGAAEIAWVEGGTALKLSREGAPPVTVASGELTDDAGFISDFQLTGDLLVWAEPKHVRAVEVATPTRPFAIGPANSVSTLDADVAANGRAVVAWTTRDGGIEQNQPLRVYGAIRERASAFFGHARTLSKGHDADYPQSGIDVAVARTGQAVVVWGDVEGRRDDEPLYPLFATATATTGGFEPVERLSRNAGLLAVAYTAQGKAWIDLYRHTAAYRVTRGRRFSAPRKTGRATYVEYRPGPGGHLLAITVDYLKPRQPLYVRPAPGG